MTNAGTDRGRTAISYSEEEIAEYMGYFQSALSETNKKLKAAGCPRAARRLCKDMAFYANAKAMAVLGVDWMGVLNGLLAAYCQEAIQNQIIYTPRKYRKKWTQKLIDEKIQICGLGESSRREIYAPAGFIFEGDPKELTALPVPAESEETATIPVCRIAASG